MKFKYNQKIKIISGFYEDQAGVIKDTSKAFFWEERIYYIKINKVGSEWILESHIGEIK